MKPGISENGNAWFLLAETLLTAMVTPMDLRRQWEV